MLRDPHTILALSVLAHVPREWSFILRAKARCGYGRQCPFPRYEGVAIHEHFLPKACFGTLRGESVRKHAAFMTINGSLTEINVENQRAQHAQANPVLLSNAGAAGPWYPFILIQACNNPHASALLKNGRGYTLLFLPYAPPMNDAGHVCITRWAKNDR